MARPSPDSWRTISRWLDELLELPREARRAWIAQLRIREPEVAAALSAWLDEYEVMDAAAS